MFYYVEYNEDLDVFSTLETSEKFENLEGLNIIEIDKDTYVNRVSILGTSRFAVDDEKNLVEKPEDVTPTSLLFEKESQSVTKKDIEQLFDEIVDEVVYRLKEEDVV
ncbi:MAG: hypothetical protein ACK5LV_04415 [Lachnospirales bacterium]